MQSPERNLVSVTLVTHNSESVIARCLESVLAQDWPELEVFVVDNASQDRTRSLLAAYQDRIEIVSNAENRGFCAAQNQALGRTQGDWVLVMNPDVLLAPDFISRLVQAGRWNPLVGTVCGKLLRALPGLEIPSSPQVDSAGIYFTPTFRHFDRGFRHPDGPEYNQPAYVFGATAAAALYRRKMIEDIRIEGEFFDEDFFLYRDDADVSWRAQLQGWRCLYLPDAVGYHVRRAFPECRRQLPNWINFHSVKNRFLMRMKNVTWPLYLRHVLPITARDLAIIGYCLLTEWSSLPAFPAVLKFWRRTMAKRRIVQQRRRVSDAYLESWFQFRPAAQPVAMSAGNSPARPPSPERQSPPILPLPAPRAKPRPVRPLES